MLGIQMLRVVFKITEAPELEYVVPRKWDSPL